MSSPTIHTAPTGDTPQERHDHATGRADAYDQHNTGATLTDLQTRLEWIDDPRLSQYTAAYLAGYRALIADLAAAAWYSRQSETALAYDNHSTKTGTR